MVDRSAQHLDMLCDLSELHTALAGSEDIGAYLRAIVSLVAKHMHVQVCSIYLCEQNGEHLQLAATHGLSADSVGNIRLAIGDGLVGKALQEQRTVCENNASLHPSFRYFPTSGEERFDAFLAVPICRGPERIGVLVAQREKLRPFEENDIKAMRATSSQLAGAIEITRALVSLHKLPAEPEPVQAEVERIAAEVASEGIVHGPSYSIRRDSWRRKFDLAECGTCTLDALRDAIEATESQLEAMQVRVEEQLSDLSSLIFEAQILMLKDPNFIGDVTKRMRDEGLDAIRALRAVTTHYIEIFENSPNAYMREKAKDVEDLAIRLLDNLTVQDLEPSTGVEGAIAFAQDLYPSDILKLSSENVAGVVLTSGGVLSHIAILARSLGIPMLIVNRPALLGLPSGTDILLDARSGALYVSPVEEVVSAFERREQDLSVDTEVMAGETVTADGQHVRLLANINLISDLRSAVALQLEGIGLYRTEFPFLVRANFPSEEEQLRVYRKLVEAMPGKTITFRTLDVGGDKCLAYYDHGTEPNPNLGMRSIRFSFRHPEIFHQQIRAILRAGFDAKELRIMFPMISSLDELLQARDAVHECLQALAKEGLEHNSAPVIGIMVEIPSVVEIIDELAVVADFLCIGTNDFVQFMLAVDRGNTLVTPYYTPHHPAVLRALRRIADAGNKHGKEVSICGELAHETEYIPFLIGIGIRTLSVDPRFSVRSQRFLKTVSVEEAEQIAKRALSAASIAEVSQVLGLPS